MDTAVRNCVQILSVVTLKCLEARAIRTDVARLLNAHPCSDLPSCHPVSRAQEKRSKRLRALKSPERYDVPLLQRSSPFSSWAFARRSWEAKLQG